MKKLILTPMGDLSSRPLWTEKETLRAERLAEALLFGFGDDDYTHPEYVIYPMDARNSRTFVNVNFPFSKKPKQAINAFEAAAVRLLAALIRPQLYNTPIGKETEILAFHNPSVQKPPASAHQIFDYRMLIEQEVKTLGKQGELLLWSIKRIPGLRADNPPSAKSV